MEVAPDAQPPVCRMMDYGKFRYEQKKEAHGPKKHTVVEIKEVKMGSRTDPTMSCIRSETFASLSKRANASKYRCFFRGREITHPELGRQMLSGVVDLVQDVAKVDIEPRLEGRNMAMLLNPEVNVSVNDQNERSKTVPKIKTNRAAAKRFRVTGSGKIKRNKGLQAPYLSSKGKETQRDICARGPRWRRWKPKTFAD